jgi:hypothetical protein
MVAHVGCEVDELDLMDQAEAFDLLDVRPGVVVLVSGIRLNHKKITRGVLFSEFRIVHDPVEDRGRILTSPEGEDG